MVQQLLPQQIEFNVLGLKLAAQRWHEGGVPVIALHGWLDNSNSFSALAQQMPAVDLVALDMAGHGWSGHRAPHAGYLIWDDLREILAVAGQLGWQRFGVLGHSRGAIIGALLAAAAPERISALGLIEGLWAQTNPAEQTVLQMMNSLRADRRQRSDRAYSTLDEMVALRCQNGFGVSEPVARELVLRNALQGADGHWHWLTDSRHKIPSLMMLTPEQQQNIHRSIQAPVELSLASQGLVLAYPDYAERLLALPHISWRLYEGGHHLHMEGAQSILGSTYNNFFQRL